MSSDLLSIGKSGTKAARAALDVTAQNIANASSTGYVRRSVSLSEVSSAGGQGRTGDISLSGVRVNGIVRNADTFRRSEVRRTGADAARANSEVAGLENVEAAVEGADVYTAIVGFEGALQELAADPTNASLRAAVVEDTRTMVNSFNLASDGLNSISDGIHFEAGDSVNQVNLLAQELGRVNLRLVRAADASSDQSTLLDQRDQLLQSLSQYTNINTTINGDQTVEVRLGGSSGPQLVAGGKVGTFGMDTATNGTISFTLDSKPVTVSGGSLAGQAQVLTKLVDVRSQLDAVANTIIATVNTAQASGVALDGSAAQPMFSGTGAAGITLALQSGSDLATAPAGAGANSRNGANLDALRNALAAADPAKAMDSALFDISSAVAGRTISRDALQTIADNAQIALQTQSGVDLDQEAVNLMRYQQAFQASGRVMQVASDIFDTILGIRS